MYEVEQQGDSMAVVEVIPQAFDELRKPIRFRRATVCRYEGDKARDFAIALAQKMNKKHRSA